jgi:hypothetical protein
VQKILSFLASEGSFLYETHNCRIVDSVYIPSFGGTGSVTLQNQNVQFRFWLDRDRMFLDVHAATDESSQSWVSIDIVRQLVTGEVKDLAIVGPDIVEFLKKHFDDIAVRFAPHNALESSVICKRLERQRAKRLFP